MATYVNNSQLLQSFIGIVNKQQVTFYMTLKAVSVFTLKTVVPIFRFERFAGGKHIEYCPGFYSVKTPGAL